MPGCPRLFFLCLALCLLEADSCQHRAVGFSLRLPKGKPQHGWRKGRESPGARQLGGPLPCPPIPQRPSMTVLPAWPCLSHTSRCPWLPEQEPLQEQEPLPCSSSATGVLTSPQRNIWVPHHPMCTPLFTDFRKRDRSRGRKEGKGDRQTDVDLLFPLLTHSLVASYMDPDQGSNLQPWCIGTMLQ